MRVWDENPNGRPGRFLGGPVAGYIGSLSPKEGTHRMNMKKLLAGILLIGGAALVASFRPAEPDTDAEMHVYKTATCGCCAKWVDHMRAAGFTVSVENVMDITAVKRQTGVPLDLASCHTALVGDYVIEGHVPARVVRAFLDEAPAALGIAVPGMPIGSPGMEGANPRPYDVLAFDKDGNRGVFERVEP